MFLETSRRFDHSSRSLGHVMFYFPGTAQEAGAGGRLGAAGIPVHGSLMGRFSLCGVIYEIACDQDPEHVYTGETKRPLGKRFKEHTNLTIPTGVGDHCNATGHSVSFDNTKVLTREPQWTKIKVKEAIYIKKSAPAMNCEQGYQLPPIYHQLQFPRKKTSRDQGF